MPKRIAHLCIADKAGDEYAQSVENGIFPLEAASEAKKNHMFLPSEKDQPELAVEPHRLTDVTDPASLVMTS